MQTLLLTLLLTGAPAQQQTIPFENLHILQELPAYVQRMPDDVYVKWCQLQNAGALREAQRRADDYQARHPLIDTYVQDSEYTTQVDQSQHEEVCPTSADFTGKQSTKYSGKNRQFTYRNQRWGGGPVVVLNPYARRTK
jgi:hypothetical protein